MPIDPVFFRLGRIWEHQRLKVCNLKHLYQDRLKGGGGLERLDARRNTLRQRTKTLLEQKQDTAAEPFRFSFCFSFCFSYSFSSGFSSGFHFICPGELHTFYLLLGVRRQCLVEAAGVLSF